MLKKTNICNPQETYHLAFPSGVTQDVALKICKKLGSGQMSAMSNDTELKSYMKWFQGKVPPGTCEEVWTPYSDAVTEGNFVNLNNGLPAKYLPWY